VQCLKKQGHERGIQEAVLIKAREETQKRATAEKQGRLTVAKGDLDRILEFRKYPDEEMMWAAAQ
jgi:hypothetical protein